MSTIFRAFQLDSEGSLFSFHKDGTYTLIEARLPKGGIEVLQQDLKYHGKTSIDLHHITSWDNDHCNSNDLIQIINHLRPAIIEVPSYPPDTEDGKLCKRIIFKYDDIHQVYTHNVRIITQDYIRTLPNGAAGGTTDIVYESEYDCLNKNDMSLIRLFRSSGFNVLSLGDCESCDIGKRLSQRSFIQTEVDVLILPHHGADNGFLTGELLDIIKPKIAICSSNHGNKYDHPRQEIRNLLNERKIELCTTKNGDVLIYHQPNGLIATAVSLQTNNTQVEKKITFTPKRFVA